MTSGTGGHPDIIKEVHCYLQYLKLMGYTHVCAGQKALDTIGQWGTGAPGIEPDKCADSFKDDISRILKDIKDCRRCRLADVRKAVIVGGGPVNAPLMFIGGFPEPEDDETGTPYSGRAGELLGKIIEAMGLDRESVYVCHAVKCRPADGRLPDRFEALACRTWLKRQIEVICPGLICTLGGFASQSLLKTDEPISRLRGRFHDYKGIQVMPTHEPAYLLVHPEAKRAVWEDMKQVMTCISH